MGHTRIGQILPLLGDFVVNPGQIVAMLYLVGQVLIQFRRNALLLRRQHYLLKKYYIALILKIYR